MKKIYFIFGLIMILSLTGMAGDTITVSKTQLEKYMAQANQKYNDGKFEEAAALYQKIVKNGYESEELYFNLGNAYYRSNNFTAAILNYERAKLLAPNDEEIEHNLQQAKQYTKDDIEEIQESRLSLWFKSIIRSLNTDTWAVLSVVSFVAFVVLLLLYLIAGSISLKKIGFWFGILMFVMSITFFVFSYKQEQYLTEHKSAIIFSPSVTVKSTPDNVSGSDLFILHEGTKVKILKSEENWCEIKLPDGRVGWLQTSDIERI